MSNTHLHNDGFSCKFLVLWFILQISRDLVEDLLMVETSAMTTVEVGRRLVTFQHLNEKFNTKNRSDEIIDR